MYRLLVQEAVAAVAVVVVGLELNVLPIASTHRQTNTTASIVSKHSKYASIQMCQYSTVNSRTLATANAERFDQQLRQNVAHVQLELGCKPRVSRVGPTHAVEGARLRL